ncbi:hypothetical protein [Halorubrum halophilum]|uniref:hypothetical protein n=1 Tax=Halorubrum halophilum TaxID=413816 RepID=UPI0012AB8DDF|nr:hypothetical protein [Halorubrum halophilum]
MTGKQPSSDRRSFGRGVLTVAGAGAIAGCTGNTGSTEEGESSEPRESDTDPAGNGSDTGESEAGGNSSEPEEGRDEQEQTPQWEKNTRNGIPLNGLGAYTDQMLEAGPVSAAKAGTINNALKGAETVEEERDALAQTLTPGNYTLLMSEYHRQRGEQGNTENQVVVNQNWSFTSDSEPILELYKVENGNLQSQPVIVDANHKYQRQTNKPGSGEPPYLAGLRNQENDVRFTSQAYQSIQNKIEEGIKEENVSEINVKQFRYNFLQDWSRVMFGVDDEPDVRPYDVETADIVFEAMYGDGDGGILADLSNKIYEEDYDTDTLVEVEFRNSEWNFHTPKNRDMGDPLVGEKERF